MHFRDVPCEHSLIASNSGETSGVRLFIDPSCNCVVAVGWTSASAACRAGYWTRQAPSENSTCLAVSNHAAVARRSRQLFVDLSYTSWQVLWKGSNKMGGSRSRQGTLVDQKHCGMQGGAWSMTQPVHSSCKGFEPAAFVCMHGGKHRIRQVPSRQVHERWAYT